jgi:hypothetical protein
MNSVIDLLLIKDPKIQYGLSVFIGMEDRKRWLINRALKARKAKKGKRWRHGRNLCG